MARRREPSTGSLSAVTGDDHGEPQQDFDLHVVASGASVAPDDRGGGGGDDRGGGAGRFGIYQGNWGGSRRKAELPEMTN